jgi:hypothetical protein
MAKTASEPAKKPTPDMLGDGAAKNAGKALAGRKRQIDDAVDKATGYRAGGRVKSTRGYGLARKK